MTEYRPVGYGTPKRPPHVDDHVNFLMMQPTVKVHDNVLNTHNDDDVSIHSHVLNTHDYVVKKKSNTRCLCKFM